MVADVMTMQGARASAAMVLEKFAPNIPVTAPGRLTHEQQEKYGCVLSTLATDALVLSTRPSVPTVLTKIFIVLD